MNDTTTSLSDGIARLGDLLAMLNTLSHLLTDDEAAMVARLTDAFNGD